VSWRAAAEERAFTVHHALLGVSFMSPCIPHYRISNTLAPVPVLIERRRKTGACANTNTRMPPNHAIWRPMETPCLNMIAHIAASKSTIPCNMSSGSAIMIHDDVHVEWHNWSRSETVFQTRPCHQSYATWPCCAVLTDNPTFHPPPHVIDKVPGYCKTCSKT
jgi:hypothetical protein